jgi:hypothetical protein
MFDYKKDFPTFPPPCHLPVPLQIKFLKTSLAIVSVVRMLLLLAGLENNPGPIEVATNADTVEWYKETQKNR